MGILKRTWNGISWALGGYVIYKRLQELSAAKDDIYQELSPELQAKWRDVFGSPVPVTISNPSLPPVLAKAQNPTDIEQVKAKT